MIDNIIIDFQTIHDTFRPKVIRYMAHLVNNEESEDLTQEVFIKVSKALESFRGESSVSTWIYRIATNVGIDRIRRKSSHQAQKIDYQDNAICGAEEDVDIWTNKKTLSIEDQLIREEMCQCLQGYIEILPLNYRSVIVLSDLEGLSNNEVAETLGVSIETVKIRLHRGRSKLRKELETHCGGYRDGRNKLAWDGRIL
jgi:RNA polymerase sigma-70 factor (ECF subfamily)